ncbi:hypothetical protein FRC12_013028 [Ceratobasidium sp. 428]|nr:hypothetical protein FRC12_013028 [Ceratobasidium sp. 428]
MDQYSALFLVFLSITVVAQYFRRLWRARNSPPSPPYYPLIGNLLSLPLGHEHLEYEKMSKSLKSDIISLSIPGMNIVVLHSAQAATDLFDKRSAIYSDRTNFTMVENKKLFGWSDFIVFERYGDRLRRHRRMLNIWLNRSAVKSFHQASEHQAHLLLQRLLKSCHEFTSSEQIHHELYRTAATGILNMAYGYPVESSDDPFVERIKQILADLAKCAVPTNFLANVFPILAHLPDWFPGTSWKQFAREGRVKKEATMSESYQWTKDRVQNGTAGPSIIHSMLQHYTNQGGITDQAESDMKQEGITMFGAGTDTMAGCLQVFALAMVMFPEAQAKAQKEIDSVIGTDRLPNISDQHDLVYVRNLVQEVLRWQPIVSLAVPHTCSKDDVYRNYHISKGTLVFGNLWAMTRDESVYPDPETFNPDRFLDPAVPPAPAFGWGRRKCPGSYYAEDFLFVCMASILATFKFSRVKDKNGIDIMPSTEPAAKATLYHPKPFACVLTYRSEKHEALVKICV